MSRKNLARKGGGDRTVAPTQKTTNFKTLVALGLSSLLPSFAFSAESNEALNQLLTAPKEANNSKIKSVENHSPVVDLRSNTNTREIQYDQVFENGFSGNQSFVYDTNENILVQASGMYRDKYLQFTANNQSQVNLVFDVASSSSDGYVRGVLGGNWLHLEFKGNGLFNIVADNSRDTSGTEYAFVDYFDAKWPEYDHNLLIESSLKFTAKGRITSFIQLGVGRYTYGSGTYIIRTPYIEINMYDETNTASGKYVINNKAFMDGVNVGYPDFFINAKNDGSVDSQTSIQKYNGNFFFNSGRTFMYLTNEESFVNGNFQLGNNSSVISFSGGSSLIGNIDFVNPNTGEHTITFDSANFRGVIKDSTGGSNRSANTTITFTNTDGKTFGSTEGVVASTYKGAIIGSFDVSSSSTTTINGGEDGSKGFLGAGTNTLFFDFKGSTKNNVSTNQRFTVGGGNANSLYAFSGFSSVDFTTLDGTNTLYSKIGNAGINLVAGTANQPNTSYLQGTLFFQKTNMTVGETTNALFADQTKIVGTDNALNNLTLGAMFGNATWNDENKDGYITSNEIFENTGKTNYKLNSVSTPATSPNINTNTSTGDIGNTDDNVKKQVAFIFSDGTYAFGGETQGYSGTILGGTNDSKYYFANAGYIGRTQIAGALGDLVLFNTAFRGDLGVNNNDVSIMLDFSNGRNGLRAESGDANANIVGAGSKNITFNFTENTLKDKFTGAVVGNATAVDASGSTDTDTAKYTMLNLKKYTADGTPADNDGRLAVTTVRAGGGSGKTLIDAFQEAGLTNFNNPSGNSLDATYGSEEGKDNTTNIGELSTTNTTLGLRGTSLDTTGITFDNYVYDLAFGSGLGELEGAPILDSILKGDIDLSSNSNTGHKITLKGNALSEATTTITFNANSFGTNGASIFVLDDSSATYETAKTLVLSGLTNNNYLSTNSVLNISNTNLEGNLWANDSATVNLNFTNGSTWKMDTSGFFLKNGGKLVIHKEVVKIGSSAPTLQIAMTSSSTQQKIELINTGMTLKLLHKNRWTEDTKLANTFTLRGTSLNTYWSENFDGGQDGLHGYADSGLNLVFAKGTNLDTTIAKGDGSNYKIIDKELDSNETYGGTYDENGYTGNYIAESTLTATKLVTRSINAVFVGEGSYNSGIWNTQGKITQNATFAFINAGTSTSKLNGSHLKNFLTTSNATTTVTLEGTSLNNSGSGIVSSGKDATTFNMTFVNDGVTSNTYVDASKYGNDLALTRAGGALENDILKVAQSSLDGGINFQSSNFNVLFVGNNSHNLSTTNIFQGGSDTSTVIFRDSDLNAGSASSSSIQNIKGTIAFDLSHTDEDMQISGTLKNMFASDSSGKYQTIFKQPQDEENPGLAINKLVFVDKNSLSGSTTLTTLQTEGNYFNDTDTFGDLANNNYQEIGEIKKLDGSISSLSLAGGATIALNGANQEIVFIGENSHGFDADSSASPTKLGDSTGSTLTFIDAGNIKVENIREGRGTINLIGTTNLDLTTTSNELTLKNDSGTITTGEGITINAIFTGSNILGTGASVIGDDGQSLGNIASTTNIGQADEQTEYHILFDYSEAMAEKDKKGFGQYQVYQGTITGLTSDSIIKFKNAGYITSDQIANTNANILVDNTQIQGSFKGDKASLDFRNNQPAVVGDIITSDPASSSKKLSRKILTFDLTGSTNELGFSNAIQAGYRIAPDYADEPLGQSILTFQNAPTLTLGDDSGAGGLRGARTPNSSAFIQSLATDAGFRGIAEAKTEESEFTGDNSSYILKGTKLIFQGTNVTANTTDHTITENTYFLDLSFDKSDVTGQTALGEALSQSALTANSIVMGALSDDNPLGLSLSFKNKTSLVGATKGDFENVLDVKLKDNAIFSLNAKSDVITSEDGSQRIHNIGTLILEENTATGIRGGGRTPADTLTLSAQSSMNIQAGAMNFVGVFDTTKDTATTSSSDYGTLNLSFGDVYQTTTDEEGNTSFVTDEEGNKVIIGNNKAYGIIAHKGAMSVSLTGDALLSDEQAQALGYTKDENQFANLVIDTSDASSTTLTLAHSSGVVGVIGKDIAESPSNQSYTSIDFSQANGGIALGGAFDLGRTNISFEGSRLKIQNDTFLKVNSGSTITLVGTTSESSKTLSINAIGNAGDYRVDLTLTNLDPSLTVKLTSANGAPNNNDWGNRGIWNIRGTNINLDTAFWSENNTNLKKFVFAKGSGTETTQVKESGNENLKLSELTTEDKINASTLSGEVKVNNPGNNGSHVTSVGIKNGSFTFIGKEALGIQENRQLINGIDGGKVTFNFNNSILKNGALILSNTNTGSRKTTALNDLFNLSGTDTFNLKVSKGDNAQGDNNSTLNAVYVNGTTQTSQTDSSITGVRYIDSSVSYASAYATSNAGGALSETQLKTLESKAYGNITLDSTVTATMKFIGENSHSFDGKTKVDSSGNVYYSADGTNWKKYEIGDGTDNTNGAVYLAASTTDTSSFALATLSGGKTASGPDEVGSRFDFDHTSVSLDLIKNAGGSTYIYNSNVVGNIDVTGSTAPSGSSTTIFFNQAYTTADTPAAINTFASKYAEQREINLDLATAHTLKSSNLVDGKLSTTSKTTNLILLGAGSVEGMNDNGNLLLNFLPDASTSSGYNYTIVSGGVINLDDYKNELGSDKPTDSGNNEVTGQEQSVFGNSNVVFIDTVVKGMNATKTRQFVDVAKNTETTWAGNTDQFIIYNFNDGASNQKLYDGKANAIKNTSENSHYIFSGIFKNSFSAKYPRVLALGSENSLKMAINKQLGSTPVIAEGVVGYLGLRGISVQGDINENTSGGNGVDIVFNSTSNLAYKEGFSESGEHYANIVEGANLVSTDLRDDSTISGYAVLKAAEGQNSVSILGNANKDITFIGEGAVEGGFDKLHISGGSVASNYTFHTVGKLSQTFLANIGLFHSESSRAASNEAVAGNFKFVNSSISGDINANQNSADSNRENTLKFENVNYSGTISGTLKKDLVFGAGSDKIKILGGSEDSIYDFSNLSGRSIELDIDMSNGVGGYINSSFAGFKEGNNSVVGSLNIGGSTKFVFSDNASWTLTNNSKLTNLELNNSGMSFNLDLASAQRVAASAEEQVSNELRVLEVSNLYSNGGQALLGVVINQEDQSKSQSDRIKAGSISGTLYVTAQDASIEEGSFETEGDQAIVLVSSDYVEGEVKGAERKEGLSYVKTELEHQVSQGGDSAVWEEATQENSSSAASHRWVLSGVNTKTNQELVDEGGFIVSNPYRMLVIETNNLNKRMGDLRDNDYNQGAWIRVFNGSDSGEGAKNLYTNIQLGYDYGTPAIGAKNYSGMAFSTSIVDIDGNQYSGKANTYSLAAYNAYIADSGLYVDTIAKYLYTDQKITPAGSSESSFGSHALSLGVEVGYRSYMGESNFYIEPQAEAIGGIIFGVKDINMGVIGGRSVTGELKTTTTINARIGLVQGYSLKTESGFRADFRLGVSLVNEFVSESNPIRLYDGITEAGTSIGNDTKAVLNVGTNLILTDQWRVYIDAERSFGGSRNVDYQANIGARFSFGDKLSSLPKPEKPLPLKLKSEEKKEQDKATVSNTQEAKK